MARECVKPKAKATSTPWSARVRITLYMEMDDTLGDNTYSVRRLSKGED
jgi:hypothetical protein